MNDPYTDTDVLLRLVTGDDPVEQQAAQELFEEVEAGTLTLRAPDTVIADAVFVLSSGKLYNLPRPKIRDALVPLLRLPGLKVQNRRALLRALEIYAVTNLDFGDAMIVATMELRRATELYSYDHDFDRVPSVSRREP
jgi:predicted nucleic acid-binding protein